MSLEESFIKYKNVTLTIMEIVKSEQYEKLDEFFSQRQLILDDINKLNCSKEQLKEFYVKYDIENLHKTLEEEMKNRKEELLVKIRQTQKRKVAVSGYNNLQAKAVFLSKEL
ncbi:hypothetical protein [Clostridium magnum]|uniref:Flagellar protein FliT n=1 Tax=Clostridium magnum DSM 2767 TaxID=1121326 RepID=A0A162ULW3_9CLOT|nr:hypothetical protein [Clostridium magnum]KZL94063.1 hypothetical protein CLMAG_11160 [Clostridium magnum DSM 2767]SHI01382.1 hypothetical protein SAMN02745944_02140 [Clostridium magnum DSM 2767]